MSRTIRWSATVLVFVCLTAGAAQARPLAQDRPGSSAPEIASRLEAAWDWFASLFRREEAKPAAEVPSDAQEKDGCSANPWGLPICG
jgi:hypothetical protein